MQTVASRGHRIGSRRPSEVAGIEVDVTPIMNMFLILLPFLVSMAVFSHLSVHEFDLPSDGVGSQSMTHDELPLTVTLEADYLAVIQGERILAKQTKLEDENHDFAWLGMELERARALQANPSKIVVAVADEVTTQDLVLCLDCCRESGFEDVGLAESHDRVGEAPHSETPLTEVPHTGTPHTEVPRDDAAPTNGSR